MIVVLDTTAFSSDFTCSGTAWRVLAHACGPWALKIYVPEVVVAETIGGYEREIVNVSAAIDKPMQKYGGRLGLRKYFEESLVNLHALRDTYSDRLAQVIADLGGVVLPPPDVPHMELAKRAVSRRKPCNQNGDGYRDTLNWLLVLALSQENPEESIYFVTDNSDDFAHESREGFHQDLLEDLADIGATGRVHLASDLATLLLSLAASHYDESADDLRKVRDQLQRGAIAAFIDTSVLPSIVKNVISAQRCGLPLSAIRPEILAVQGVRDLELDVKGVAENGGAFAEFTFTAETLIGLDLIPTGAELPAGLELAVGIGKDATALKDLSFGGLIQLDLYGRPVSGEVSKIEALSNDPGLEPWRVRLTGLTAWRVATQSSLAPSIVDPRLFEAAMPKIDPKLFTAMMPKIDLSNFGPITGTAWLSGFAAGIAENQASLASDDLDEEEITGDEDADETDN